MPSIMAVDVGAPAGVCVRHSEPCRLRHAVVRTSLAQDTYLPHPHPHPQVPSDTVFVTRFMGDYTDTVSADEFAGLAVRWAAVPARTGCRAGPLPRLCSCAAYGCAALRCQCALHVSPACGARHTAARRLSPPLA